MKLRPLHDRVVIRRTEEERKSPGGIVIPDTATEKPIKGEVLAELIAIGNPRTERELADLQSGGAEAAIVHRRHCRRSRSVTAPHERGR